MSWCWTLTHVGLVVGIETSGSHQGKPYVEIGAEYARHARTGGPTTLKRQPKRVMLDRNNPPETKADRLMRASVRHDGVTPYFRRPCRDDKGVLLYVDTHHTPSCESGGGWSTSTKDLVREFISGNDGHTLVTQSSENPNDTPRADKNTCYKKGLMLLLPGARLVVDFNAPGTLTAEVAYNGGRPAFHVTESKIDSRQELELKLLSSDSYRETGVFFDPFSDKP